jgi:hypothetical protein
MILIGITGGIGHGKSALADDFGRIEPNSLHLESSSIIATVADAMHARTTVLPSPHDLDQINAWLQALPEILAQTLQITVSYDAVKVDVADIAARPELYEKLFIHLENLAKNPELLRSRIMQNNKVQYRAMLQWLGSYLIAKVDPGIWYAALIRQVHEAEARGAALCTIGGVRFPSDANAIRAAKGRILHIVRPLISEPDKSDPTERERSKIVADITVTNDAGLVELIVCAERIYIDIKLGKLKQRYITSDVDKKNLSEVSSL